MELTTRGQSDETGIPIDLFDQSDSVNLLEALKEQSGLGSARF